MKKVTVNRGCVWVGKKRYPVGSSFDINDKEADRLIRNGVVTETESDGIVADSEDPEKLTVAQLKDLLDKLKIEYPANAKKAELLELLEKNTAPPPEDDE
jgi:hypothetical protein